MPGAWQPLGRVQRSVVQWFKVLKRTEGSKKGRKEGMVQWSRNKNNSSLTMIPVFTLPSLELSTMIMTMTVMKTMIRTRKVRKEMEIEY